jgi:hypothetical protein
MKLKNVEIKRIGEIKEFGANNFKVVKWVVVDDSNADYPQTLELQCTQDKAENLVKYNKVGDRVDVDFNLRGREWTNETTKVTSVFNTIEAWKVFKAEPTNGEPTDFQAKTVAEPAEEDDLPF